MKKGERRVSLMGIECALYRDKKSQKWIVAASLSDREQFNRFLYQLLGDDMIKCSQTEKKAHVETRFTNINELMKKLRQPKDIES